jgi:uncharacterized protein YdeI (YjbR/CyaY-like superfamily)
MAANLIALDLRTRAAWRRWLARNHATSRGIWLVRHKPHSGVRTMPHEDVVCEALCFGWIDSLVKRLDDDRYAIKVTPRKPASKWSDANRKRWKRLQAAGRLAPPRPRGGSDGEQLCAAPPRTGAPAYIARAFQAHPRAWQHFQTLARRGRRDFVVWIHLAKRPETRDRRIRESIELLSAGKQLGLK